MSSEEFAASRFEIAQEPADEVVLKRAIVETTGLQPEDLGVLAALLLRDPHRPSTMEAIRKDLAAQGWRMGKDRYNAVAARLTKAGHLSRISVYDEAAQRPTWVTRVFRNPANNAQYVDLGIAASSQLSAEVRETRDPRQEGSAEVRETRDSPGQSRNAGFPRSGSESRETRDSAEDVSAGQSRNAGNPRFGAPPPHPPEEEGTSSPYPLTDPAGSLPSQREEEAGVSVHDEERLEAARVFLGRLPHPWTVGRRSARLLAPLLLDAADDQGWALDDDLAAELTQNPDGVKNHVRVLERNRIPDLVRREMVHPASAPTAESGARVDGPSGLSRAEAIAACTVCDSGGLVPDPTDPDDDRLLKCTHPDLDLPGGAA
ncbi:hypothetical protein AB0M66_31075 [Streptomyces albidoflavus]|uniref:hypothetical protein n=1 Tax=Streptomyces albidoflavus TaxID=1886 RepID=UPI00342231A2